jgi:hypothetical protein
VASSHYDLDGGSHKWYTAPSGTAGDAISFTQAMTLDASGRLGIGSTETGFGFLNVNRYASAPLATLSLGDFATPANSIGIYMRGSGQNAISWASGGYLGFYADGPGSTERARIDSSGNLLIGTTSSTFLADSGGFIVYPTATGETNFVVKHDTGTGSGASYASFTYATSNIGSITQSGTTAVLYNVTSDQRLKENIVDAPEFGSVIDSLQVRSFNWKTDQTHQRAGFIAQELVTVAPEAVYQPADPEAMMAVDYSKLVPMLVKEIQDLRARLAAANI